MKQTWTELEGEIGLSTNLFHNFNGFSAIDRIGRKKSGNDIEDLENCIHPLGLIENNRPLYFQTAKHISFSSALGIFSYLDQILGHKKVHNCQDFEII